MANYNLTKGINLGGRLISSTIPDDTAISEFKIIAKVDEDNYIAEDYANGVSRGYFHTVVDNTDVVVEFYSYDGNETTVNVSGFRVPNDFGTIVEVDKTATLYQYLTRVSNEKVYVISEDFSKEESLPKSAIEAKIEEDIRGYGVPVGSVFGFDEEGSIPAGFVEILIADDDMRY